ncbi:MAG: carbohydrate ABC transporter permease, partial [Spirochaetia bacterium]
MMRALRKAPVYVILILLTAMWLLPVASSFLVSFKSSEDFVSQTFYQLPTKLYFLTNLATVIAQYRLLDNLGNSLMYSALGTLVVVITASLAGFSIVRLRPKFNFALFLIIYSGTLFPFQMYLIPVYRLFNTLNLY